jgi:3-deoxy-D-manno-octulosonic-acid transferase
MYALYNLILNVAFVIAFPYLFLRAAFGGHGVKERMGRLPREKTERLQGKKIIWFHAASVGEVKVLSTIIPEVKKRRAQYAIVVSTVTKTGRREAERLLEGIELVFFLPVDLKRFVRRTLNRLEPKTLILVETELWPNLIREAKTRGCPVTLINGRISESSLGRYLLVKSLMQRTLSCIDLLCMQSEEHKRRIMLLGADARKIEVTGNLKFDRLVFTGQAQEAEGLRRELHIPDHFRVIVGGSVRSGEENMLIPVFKRLQEENDNLLFILAPRHLDRLKVIEMALSDQQMQFVRRNQLDQLARNTRSNDGVVGGDRRVIILDTIGELFKIYSLADVAFVGGSLVPVGGHNLLEPAIHGVPVLFGPYVDNSKEEAQILIESGGGIQVQNTEQLYLSLSGLLSDNAKRTQVGKKAKEVVQQKTGVSRRTADLIFSLLDED